MSMLERLGLAEGTRGLIIHADDSGMCHGANVATRDALNSGAVNSTAVMVPCPWFPEFAGMCREHPEWDVGVHLTHTAEWTEYRWGPVLSATDVPGLVDDEGYLWRQGRGVTENATADEIERESRAQIDRAIEFGIRPTHIDTHMGVMGYSQAFAEVYHRLGDDYDLPVTVRGPLSAEVRDRIGPALASRIDSDAAPVVLHSPGHVESVAFEARMREYQDVLRALEPGVTQITLHLGTDSEEMAAIMPVHIDRVNDLRAFSDASTRALIESESIQLVQWRDIGAAYC
jgi:chitin disaccharide deacetylase